MFNPCIEPGQPAHTCSLIRLYTVGSSTSSSHLHNAKNDKRHFKTWYVNNSIEEIQQVRVNNNFEFPPRHSKKLFGYLLCENGAFIKFKISNYTDSRGKLKIFSNF